MAKIKGTGFLSTIIYIGEHWGTDGMERVKAVVSPATRDLLARPVLPVLWYPYRSLIEILLAADKVLGQDDMALVRKVGRFDAERNFKGVYKMFISLTTPHFLISNSARVWRQYFDEGTVTTEQTNETSGLLSVREFSDMPVHHEINQMPFMERALEMCGCKDVRGTHPKCLARGDDRCEFKYSWK